MPVGLDPPRITGMSVIDSLLSGQAGAFKDAVRHLILPTIVLGTVPLAVILKKVPQSHELPPSSVVP